MPEWYRRIVRAKVCKNLPFYGKQEDHEYCVLHYPKMEKAADFETVFEHRISLGEWDFERCYFPIALKYEKRDFTSDMNFNSAVFNKPVMFKDCNFHALVQFSNSLFMERVEFAYSHFFYAANFQGVKAAESISFAFVHFHSDCRAYFEKATLKSAVFHGTEFGNTADFKEARFIDYSSFLQTKFFSKSIFVNTVFPESRETSFHFAEFHKSVDFGGADLFEADFTYAKFGVPRQFDTASFNKTKFRSGVNFSNSTFHVPADFTSAFFDSAGFIKTTFARGVRFSYITLTSDAFFNETKFGQKADGVISSGHAYFDHALFSEESRIYFQDTWVSSLIDFNHARFKGYVFFLGTTTTNRVFDSIFEENLLEFQSLISFLNATIEKPERVYFRSVRLRPSWFLNIDCRKFNFIDIDWTDEFGKEVTAETELRSLKKRDVRKPHKLLSITLRQLAEGANDNDRFDEASKLRRMAMETEWIGHKKDTEQRINQIVLSNDRYKKRFGSSGHCNGEHPSTAFTVLRRMGDFLIYGAYRATSQYGESWSWAALILILILAVSAFAYTRINFYVCPMDKPIQQSSLQNLCETRHLSLTEATRHSLLTATLQNVETRKPATAFGEAVVLLEKILAPLQLALVALAVRRKFMR